MRYRHIIWDFDGTLFDSYPHIAGAFSRSLADAGIHPPADEILEWLKKSVGEALRHFCGDNGMEDQVRRVFKEYENDWDKVPIIPYSGAEKVCGEIRNLRGENYLYSHRGRSAMDILEKYGMSGHFRYLITKEDNFPLKPAPDAVNFLVDRYDLRREECLFVGDRDIDLLCGKNAGIDSCLFDPDGFYSHFEAELRINRLEELLIIIQ